MSVRMGYTIYKEDVNLEIDARERCDSVFLNINDPEHSTASFKLTVEEARLLATKLCELAHLAKE